MITLRNITKTYTNGVVETHVLKGITLDVKKGEFVAIMGKSGAGKSTLLYQMSLLDTPTSGQVEIDGVDVSVLSEEERTDFRLHELGYIFQDYALVPDLTATENVMMPMLMVGQTFEQAKRRAHETLKQIGLGERLNNLPNQMSGGEQQRVSIARAVVGRPTILFADEPTANLDSISSKSVMGVLKELHKAGQTIVMVTHEAEYARDCDRIITIEDGQVVDQKKHT